MTDAEFRTLLARWYDVRSYANLFVIADRAAWVQERYEFYILRHGFTFTEAIEEARDTIAHITRDYRLRPIATSWSRYPETPPTTPATLN